MSLTVAVSISATAQGVVQVSNNFIPAGASAKAFVLGCDGLPLPKAVGRVEVLDMQGQLIAGSPDRTGASFGAAGLFFLNDVVVPNTVPGGSAWIMLRVWDSGSGSTFDSASIRAMQLVNYSNLGGDDSPAPRLSSTTFSGMQLCDCWCPPFPPPPPPALAVTISAADANHWRIQANAQDASWYVLYTSADLVNWTETVWRLGGATPLEWIWPVEGPAGYFRVGK